MMRLRRLLPSVASQVGATIALSLGLAHVLTVAAFLWIVNGEDMASDPLVAAGRVAGLVEALDAGFVPPDGYGPHLRRADATTEPMHGEGRVAGFVSRLVPGEGRVASVAVPPSATRQEAFLVQAGGGSWVVTIPMRPWYKGPFVLPALSSLAALLICGPLLLAYAVRRLTAPLRVLAEATRGFAGDAVGSPLPETGPREISEVAGAFNAMRDRVSGLVEARARMLAALGHDLRTPLTRLRLRAEMSVDTELREAVVREVERVDAMLTDALAFASPEASLAPAENIDLASLVSTACAEYADLGKAVAYDGPGRLPASASESALNRIVGNLIDNGLRHGEHVSVSLASEAGRAVLVVSDDGPGIAPEMRERVFEPFYTTDAARRRTGQGFGLGLSIVRDLAGRMGGDVTLSQGASGGLAATVRLPVLRLPARAA